MPAQKLPSFDRPAETAARSVRDGLEPGAPSAGPLALRPGMEALPALRLVHRGLLGRILECRALALAAVDVEALHDLRVAIRRTRAALGEMRGVYLEAESERFREEFGWLARATGPARDLDVFAEWLRHYASGAPDRIAEGLQSLDARLHRDRAGEQERLAELLESARAVRLLEHWERALESGDAMAGPRAATAIETLVRARFEHALSRMRRRAAALGPHPAAEAIHRLRLAGKKARYLIDLFEPLHPQPVRERLSPSFRALQDALGDYHDAALQERRVLHFGDRPDRERGRAATTTALVRLRADLERRQAEVLQVLPALLAAVDVD